MGYKSSGHFRGKWDNIAIKPITNSRQAKMHKHPEHKLTIIGGGIIAALEAYFAFLEAKAKQQPLRITINEKNQNITQTTAANLVPSLTPDEILAVVPRGNMLVEKLKLLFNQPGGIRVDDVPGVNDSPVATDFIQQVQLYGKNHAEHELRTALLFNLGKLSMQLWQNIYDTADAELQEILRESNFQACREPSSAVPILHDGYRIDLIFNIPDAAQKALAMQQDYINLGYKHCKILSPQQVLDLDPYLTDYCYNNAKQDNTGKLVWNNNAVALYRPGGCIDSEVFLPKFYAYLSRVMGTYVNHAGQEKHCFRLKFNRYIEAVVYTTESNFAVINGIKFNNTVKYNKHKYLRSEYVFCPGEAVGTLSKLGFYEPAYAGFAGASLKLNIPVASEHVARYSGFNHCMEVHEEGVVLDWRARLRAGKIFIGVGGTKAFYAAVTPDKDQAFALDRNLLQLNIINNVLPEFVSLALQRDTKGETLTAPDLIFLEKSRIAQRWVGTRAVAYDGFPTLGPVYNQQGRVHNARCTTHAGSGGASFAPALVFTSRNPAANAVVANYASSNRRLKAKL